MKYRRLGRTGWEVSEVGLGTYPLGGALQTSGSYWSGPATYGAVARKEAIATLHAGLAQRLSFIDTAPVYGEAEAFIGEALQTTTDQGGMTNDQCPMTNVQWPMPNVPAFPIGHLTLDIGHSPTGRRCYVATKCGEHVRPVEGGGPPELVRDFSRAALRQSLEQSRRRLGMETLDLVLLHSPGAVELGEDPLGLLVELRDRGEIAHVGVSAQSVRQAIELIEEDSRPEVLQAPFNLLQPEAAQRLLPLAAERSVGIVIRSPLASGFLTGEIAEDHVFAADDHRSVMSQEQIARQARQARAFSWLVEERVAASLSEAALRYILSFPGVSTVIPGAMRVREIEWNLAVSDLGPLPAAALQRVEQTQQSLGLLR